MTLLENVINSVKLRVSDVSICDGDEFSHSCGESDDGFFTVGDEA
jgi:hypothetical protein